MKPGQLGQPSLDHLRVLIAVVEAGSFSAASRALNRAQSVISYAITTLEGQLGLRLIARGQRRLTLTEAGQAVLADARRMELVMNGLRARAAGLTSGLEPEVSLVVDVMFPTAALVAALQEFAATFPTVAMRLRVEALGSVVQLVLDRTCGLGIGGAQSDRSDLLTRAQIDPVRLVPVAAPCHPLATLAGPIGTDALREQTQLVLSDRSTLTEGQDFAVFSWHRWRLGDLGAKHALLLAGLGWGFMPEPMVRPDIAVGRLRRLALADHREGSYAQFLFHRPDAPPGPAGRWLAERLSRPADLATPQADA